VRKRLWEFSLFKRQMRIKEKKTNKMEKGGRGC